MNDFIEMKQKVDVFSIYSKYLQIERKGSTRMAVCPFHNERSPSLAIFNDGKFKCFGCGSTGDIFDFLVKMGRSFSEAKREVSGDASFGEINPIKLQANKKIKWKHICPVPKYASNPDFTHYLYGSPSKIWAYRNEKGEIIGYVCRFETGKDKKEMIPMIFAEDESGRKNWRWQGFQTPRPIFNLDVLVANPNSPVLIVEGEKTAEAAMRLFPNMIVVTWCGGAKSIKCTDWSVLKGRKIVLWADNDKDFHDIDGVILPFTQQPGNSAMIAIYGILKPICEKIRFVWNEKYLPHKWDVADADWTKEEAMSYLKSHLFTYEEYISIKL